MPENNPSLTQGHFQFIADVINEFEWEDSDEQARFAERMADELERHNPRFKRELFLDACGVSEDDEEES